MTRPIRIILSPELTVMSTSGGHNRMNAQLQRPNGDIFTLEVQISSNGVNQLDEIRLEHAGKRDKPIHTWKVAT